MNSPTNPDLELVLTHTSPQATGANLGGNGVYSCTLQIIFLFLLQSLHSCTINAFMFFQECKSAQRLFLCWSNNNTQHLSILPRNNPTSIAGKVFIEKWVLYTTQRIKKKKTGHKLESAPKPLGGKIQTSVFHSTFMCWGSGVFCK